MLIILFLENTIFFLFLEITKWSKKEEINFNKFVNLILIKHSIDLLLIKVENSIMEHFIILKNRNKIDRDLPILKKEILNIIKVLDKYYFKLFLIIFTFDIKNFN